jgi:hypothetical protein
MESAGVFSPRHTRILREMVEGAADVAPKVVGRAR